MRSLGGTVALVTFVIRPVDITDGCWSPVDPLTVHG